MIQLLNQHEDMTTAMLVEHWRDQPEYPHLQKLAVSELFTHSDNAQVEVCEIIKRLEKTYLIEQWDALIEKSKSQQLDESEKATLKQLQQAIHKG